MSADGTVRFYLVDDHTLVREALRDLIHAQPDFEVVGEAESVDVALQDMRKVQPDVLTLDLVMPGLTGREAVARIVEAFPTVAVVVVSQRVVPEEIHALCQAGVTGYVSKNSPAAELLRVLRSAARREVSLCPEATLALVRAVRTAGDRPGNPLSERQMQVLERLARGWTTRQVAEDMTLSPKTVEKYRGEILRVLNARNVVMALEKARRLNLIEEP